MTLRPFLDFNEILKKRKVSYFLIQTHFTNICSHKVLVWIGSDNDLVASGNKPTIAWANVSMDFWRYMTSLDHTDLIKVNLVTKHVN